LEKNEKGKERGLENSFDRAFIKHGHLWMIGIFLGYYREKAKDNVKNYGLGVKGFTAIYSCKSD